jgi:serine/threonine-protein kinase
VLSAEATGRGEHRVAAKWWRRLLELDPLSSNAALGLMTALDNAGEHAEALRRGQAYGELVHSELGADPPPELSQWLEQHRHVAGNGAATHPALADRFTTAGDVAAPRRRGLRVGRWVTALSLSALAAAGVFLSRSRPASPTDPNLLAVAPFDALDPSLEIWREGLVDILSRNLDGAGPLRTVAQSVGLKRWQGRSDRVSAESFGHRTGAGLVVFGSVGRARDTVSLRATVLDLAKERVESDLEVKGDMADIGALADSLGVRILQLLGRNRPIGAVRRVSIGSRSLPALKAFLYGEQFYRRGLWDSAMVYYDQAIAQDSTFAIAFRRMATVVWWDPPSAQAYRTGVEYHRKSVRLNRGLSPKDSMLIAADSFGIAAEEATDPADLIRFSYRALSTLEETARRYPDDPEVWYELGDAQYHNNPPLGGVPAAALEALDHAIALDPGFGPAYEHTVHLAIRLNDVALARKYAAAYLRLDPTDVNARSIRLAAAVLDPARSDAPETVRMIDTVPARVLFAAFDHLSWSVDSAEVAVRLARALARRSDPRDEYWADTLMYSQFLAIELIYRGHLHEGYAVDRRLVHDPDASQFSHLWDPFLVLSLLGVMPDSLAARTFGQALAPGKVWPMPQFSPARQVRGLPWWQARRDTVSLARFALRAEQEARTQKSARGKIRGRYLHASAIAYLALARADSAEALRLFRAIPDTLCIENDCYFGKLTEARLLRASGQARQAGGVLDRWVWGGGPLFTLGVLERGRIAESLGERQKARDSYRFVVDVWRHADPELEPYIREARAGLERLADER